MEERAEHDLPGSKKGGREGGGEAVGRGEKWPKQCIHI
jgi:hypothetical protein